MSILFPLLSSLTSSKPHNISHPTFLSSSPPLLLFGNSLSSIRVLCWDSGGSSCPDTIQVLRRKPFIKFRTPWWCHVPEDSTSQHCSPTSGFYIPFLWCFQLQVFYSCDEKQFSRRFEVSQKTREQGWKHDTVWEQYGFTNAPAIPCQCVQWVGQK